MKTFKFAHLYSDSEHVSDLDITMEWVDTWALQKPITMQNDSTTGLVCLIEFVHLLLTASHARITNRNPNTGKKFHWNNGRMKLHRFAQPT